MSKAIFVAAFLVAAAPCFAQQVRVINGDIEHIYGPNGQLLDDAELRAKNERAQRQMQKQKANPDQGPVNSENYLPPISAWRAKIDPGQLPESAWGDSKNRQQPQSWWSEPR
jgi:hypothetical protein